MSTHGNKGRPLTERHKRKIGLANKGKVSWAKGKTFSLNYRRKLSEARKGMRFSEEHRKHISEYVKAHPISYWKGKKRPSMTGDKHPRFKGYPQGINHKIRTSAEYVAWRSAVFKRDNYKCQMPGCDQKMRYLEANHILLFADYPNLRFQVRNGITLCRSCHKQTKGNKELQYQNVFTPIAVIRTLLYANH